MHSEFLLLHLSFGRAPPPSMPTFHCSAILFDLDGVLVDSTRSVSRLWRRWATENGIDPERVLAIAHGVRTIEVVQRLAPHLDLEAEVQRIERRESEDTDGVAVMPGAADLIRSIPEARWCVVTSGTHLLAAARLRLVGLPTPRVLVTADEVKKGKPDPEPYLKGAQLLGFDGTQHFRESLPREEPDSTSRLDLARTRTMAILRPLKFCSYSMPRSKVMKT